MYYAKNYGNMYLVIVMKKCISLFLALLMIVSLFSVSAFAESNVKLSLTSETVYAGEEFTLNLFISDNSKMSGAVIEVNYDKNMLEYVSAEQGGILDTSANISIKNIDGENAKVRFTYLAHNSSVTAEGVLMSITFKALNNANGETDLKITVPNAGDFVTQNLERISYTTSDSVVKIVNTTHIDDSEVDSSSTTDESSSSTEKDTQTTEIKNDYTENNEKNDDKDDNTLIAVLLGVGFLLITVGVVMLVQSKKKKE